MNVLFLLRYLLAMCYYEQITDETKDLGSIIEAQQNFQYVLKNHPNTDYATRFRI